MGKPELADIFRLHGPAYLKRHRISARQAKVIGSITKCRTAALGGHVCACDSCGCTKVCYNSCRDRHCPKCQSLARERWLAKRTEELLPVPHYHLVFTIPPALHDLMRRNEKRLYGELFRQAWSSLRTLCAEEKYLGGRTGMLAVLHTWGQNLHYHPHLHCLVPAGGLSFDGDNWKKPRHKNFLVPVRALSRLFRGRLVGGLRTLNRENKLKLPEGRSLCAILDEAMKKEWVVYAKPPFCGPKKLLDYLGRYIKRVAIGNYRIKRVNEAGVEFSYRDYADDGKVKRMKLSGEEFIRRFLQHVLPGGFCKIRYYGLMATRNRQTRLAKCHELLAGSYQRSVDLPWQLLILKLTGRDPTRCEDCGVGRMLVIEWLKPRRSPPLSARSLSRAPLHLPLTSAAS